MAQFRRDLYCLECAGFVVLRSELDKELTDAVHAEAESFEREVDAFAKRGEHLILRHGWPLQSTRALYAIGTRIQSVMMHERILAMARGYLGNVVIRDCLMQTNMPDPQNTLRGVEGAVSFHRDTRWQHDEVIRPRYLHAFVLLHDFTRENGATLVVPGTHRSREPGYYFKDTDRGSNQAGINYRVFDKRYFPSAIHIEAPKGSVVFLDPMTIHTQGVNVTAQNRSLINITFRAADVCGQPPLLNSRELAERHARVPVRPDLLELLEASPSLPSQYGPLGRN